MVALHISERAFQAHVERVARLFGWRQYHTHDSRRSSPGFPDLVLVRNGELCFLELKTETGRVRPEQREWLEELEKVPGIVARIIRPSDWQELEELLRR